MDQKKKLDEEIKLLEERLEEKLKKVEGRLEEKLRKVEERKEQIIERLLEIDEQKKRSLAQHPSRLVAEEDWKSHQSLIILRCLGHFFTWPN